MNTDNQVIEESNSISENQNTSPEKEVVNTTNPEEDYNSYQIYIAQLNSEKLKYAEEGRYVEADQIKKRIQEIKDSMEGKNKKALLSQHEIELHSLEEEYNREIMEYHNKWENKMSDFQTSEKSEEDVLNDSHNKEMKSLSESIDETYKNIIPKHSREYLDLRQVEMTMVKQERYLEAHLVKTKADSIVRKEEEKFNKEKSEKIKNKVDKLMKKQNLERTTMKEKFAIEFEMLKKHKETDLERLVNKFKNRKYDLDIQQKNEKLMTENTNMMRASKLLI